MLKDGISFATGDSSRCLRYPGSMYVSPVRWLASGWRISSTTQAMGPKCDSRLFLRCDRLHILERGIPSAVARVVGRAESIWKIRLVPLTQRRTCSGSTANANSLRQRRSAPRAKLLARCLVGRQGGNVHACPNGNFLAIWNGCVALWRPGAVRCARRSAKVDHSAGTS